MGLRAFNLGEFHEGKAQQPLPAPLMTHESEFSHFESLCHDLCMKILRLFALGLNVRTVPWLVCGKKAGLDGGLDQCRRGW